MVYTSRNHSQKNAKQLSGSLSSDLKAFFPDICSFILGASIRLLPFLSTSANWVSAVDKHCLFCVTTPLLGFKPPPREGCVLWAVHNCGPKPPSTRGTVWLAMAMFTDWWTTAPFSSVRSSVNTTGRWLSQITKEEQGYKYAVWSERGRIWPWLGPPLFKSLDRCDDLITQVAVARIAAHIPGRPAWNAVPRKASPVASAQRVCGVLLNFAFSRTILNILKIQCGALWNECLTPSYLWAIVHKERMLICEDTTASTRVSALVRIA